ncbi:MAG: helix-turn-helix domain-containing protein [Bacteroidales bacterium]|nr:helix-turn-helix domain-containing protein [Bacteroidales bacterium]
MINQLYYNLTLSLVSALLVLGVLFRTLCSSIESPVFKTALRMMTFTYCIFGLVKLLELWSRSAIPDADNVLLFRIVTLIVAVFQAFLFTYTLILLIHAAYLTRKRMINELIPIVVLSVAFVVAFFILPAAYLRKAVHLFTIFYIFLLVKYSRLFIVTYRLCLQKMNNYFSGQEVQELRWVKFSFFAALSIGVLALASSLIPMIHIGVACKVVYLLFYLYFAIRFINYGFVYKKMEAALSDNNIVPQHQQNTQQGNGINILEAKLKKWIDQQRFLQPGITIEGVALEIGTNRNYLSEHINAIKGKNFRQWINELRIAEAKILLKQHPEMNLNDIASKVGFVNKSHFGRIFLAITNSTPQEWRVTALP